MNLADIKAIAGGILRKYFLLFFVIFMAVLIWKTGISFNDVIKTLSALTLSQLLLLLVLFLMNNLNLILKNIFLLRVLNHKVKFRNIALIFYSSALAQYAAPGKIGYPLTTYLLNKMEAVEYSQSTAMLTIDFVIFNAFTAFVAFMGFFVFFKNQIPHLLAGLAVVLLCVCCTVVVFLRYIKHGRKDTKLYAFTFSFYRSLSNFSIKHFGLLLVFYGINACLNALYLKSIIYFFGADISLWRVLTADTASFIAGSISMIPMGLGVQDASLFFFLNTYGISKEIIVAIIMTQRLMSTILIYVMGIISGLLLGLKKASLRST